jgi:DNA-directed RNA polymerase subunit RPC12/RpoP
MGFKKPLKYLSEYPNLMKEWDWERNKKLGLDPTILTPGCYHKAWWKCQHRHIWLAPIMNRGQGHGCPYCSHKKVTPGVTDLLTKYPELSKQWHPTLNIIPVPMGVSPHSYKTVFWQCKHGHIWEKGIYWRTLQSDEGCPYCSGKRVWNDDALKSIQHHPRIPEGLTKLLDEVTPYLQQYYMTKKQKNNININKWIVNVDYNPWFFKDTPKDLQIPEGVLTHKINGDPDSVIFEFLDAHSFNEYVFHLYDQDCWNYCHIECITKDTMYLKIHSR